MTVVTRTPKLGFEPASLPGDLWIGGRSRPGRAGRRIDVVDPSTGSRLAAVADATVEDALDAVAAAHAALPGWAAHRRRASARRCCAAPSS